MKIRYVTIEREYGSGGTEIAEELAERCGISCYGREVLEMAAGALQISVDAAEWYEEKVTNKFLYSMFVMTQAQKGDTDMMPMESKLYVAEHEAIQNLARRGPAVFVGHCASEALEETAGVLRVFIRASDEYKIQRAVDEYGIARKDAESVCKRYNKKRAHYYAVNTSQKWDDLSNYDIVLDSSRIGIDGCVDAIAAIVR